MKIEYDSHGKVVKKIPVARDTGTTVTVTNLFHSLPVRLHEFKRNIKKEYAKCISVIQAYALVSVNTRISCSNVSSKGLVLGGIPPQKKFELSLVRSKFD